VANARIIARRTVNFFILFYLIDLAAGSKLQHKKMYLLYSFVTGV
jgi:hypothetical protein